MTHVTGYKTNNLPFPFFSVCFRQSGSAQRKIAFIRSPPGIRRFLSDFSLILFFSVSFKDLKTMSHGVPDTSACTTLSQSWSDGPVNE